MQGQTDMNQGADCSTEQSQTTVRPSCLRRAWYQYQTFITPSAFEPAPVSRPLSETLIRSLDRDDRLRRTCLRRRWQGLSG